MLDRISKKQFEEVSSVRNTIYDILDYFENHIFYDMNLKQYVTFENRNNKLQIKPM